MAGLEGLLKGRLLGGRYRVEEVIGRGGMGAVYRARDERLGREVAAKVITLAAPDEATRERLRARFRHEAASAARLPHHPNVVPVYDYGTDEEMGLDYLVMELLRGEDLATRLASGELPPMTSALSVLRGAAAGIAVGHRAGLIHRDVKPGNVFLVRQGDGDEVQVRVLDFGIAKVAEEEDSLGLTQEGAAPHSPRYASPEQLRGLHRLAPSSDVFSLGAIGYQLLSGSRPFSEEERNRLALGMEAHARPLRELNPAVPPEVAAVIERALATDAAERQADADALLAELDEAMRSLGDATLPPYAGAAVPLPVTPPRKAAAPEDDRTLLDPGPSADDDRTLLDPRAASPAAPAPPPRRPVPAPPPRRYEEERAGAGVWVATLAVLLVMGAAGVFAWWWFFERPLPHPVAIEEEIPEAPPELPDFDVDTELEPEPEPDAMDAFLANQEGMRFYQAGDFQNAVEQFRRAVRIDPDDPAYRNNFARALHRLGLHQEAEEELVRVTRMDPGRAVAYANLADTRLALADTTGAIAALERFLEVNTDIRQQGIQERRLRDLRAARAQPAPDIPPPPPPPPPAARPDTLPRE
jgi:serine/threonine protein kinase